MQLADLAYINRFLFSKEALGTIICHRYALTDTGSQVSELVHRNISTQRPRPIASPTWKVPKAVTPTVN